jgi:two-component system phosphate regulon response regulator PhoB
MDRSRPARSILVVEDERDLLCTLEYNLGREGYLTRVAASGEEAMTAIAADPPPDLILLDVLLPDRLGTEICRRLRASPRTRSVPVIMLTARGEEIDRVVGFEVGADDYIVKPFSVRELILRIRAILRRADTRVAEEGSQNLVAGPLKVEPASHRTWVGAREVQLCALEFKLLSTLLRRRGRVQTRRTLLSDVWGMSAEIHTRTIDVHVKRLREKLGPAGVYIETLRGVGYRFRADSEAA